MTSDDRPAPSDHGSVLERSLMSGRSSIPHGFQRGRVARWVELAWTAWLECYKFRLLGKIEIQVLITEEMKQEGSFERSLTGPQSTRTAGLCRRETL